MQSRLVNWKRVCHNDPPRAITRPKPSDDRIVMHKDGTHSSTVDFYRMLVATCLITFACYFASSMRLPVVPLFARELGIGTAQIGVINSAFYLMAGLLSLPLGYISDMIGRRWLATFGLVIISGGLFLLYFSRSYFHLTAIYILLGIGVSAFGPTMMSFVAAITPPTHLGRAYGWYTTALFCGISMGPAVGGLTGQLLGYPPVFLLSAVICTLTMVMLVRFLSFRSMEPKEGDKGVDRIAGLKQLARNHPLLGCWLATFGANIISGTFFTFLPLHAQNKGLNVKDIGIIFFCQALINAVSRIPFGYFSDRVSNRKYLVLAGLLFIALSIAGFNLTHTFLQFLMVALCLGASLGLAFTSVGALIAETVPQSSRGLAMGGYNTSIYLGMMTGSVVFGPIIESTTYAFGFLLAGVINLFFIAAYFGLMRSYRPNPESAPSITP